MPKNDAQAPSPEQILEPSQHPEFLTVCEWATITRVGRSKAYAAVREGEVPHIRFGKIIRIPRSALEVR